MWIILAHWMHHLLISMFHSLSRGFKKVQVHIRQVLMENPLFLLPPPLRPRSHHLAFWIRLDIPLGPALPLPLPRLYPPLPLRQPPTTCPHLPTPLLPQGSTPKTPRLQGATPAAVLQLPLCHQVRRLPSGIPEGRRIVPAPPLRRDWLITSSHGWLTALPARLCPALLPPACSVQTILSQPW